MHPEPRPLARLSTVLVVVGVLSSVVYPAAASTPGHRRPRDVRPLLGRSASRVEVSTKAPDASVWGVPKRPAQPAPAMRGGAEVASPIVPRATDDRSNRGVQGYFFTLEGSRIVRHLRPRNATAAAPDQSFEGDCGYATCTLRLNRARTRDARDAGWLVGAAGGACAVVSAGVLAVICGAAIAPAAVVLAVAAGRFYEDGDCLKIKFAVTGQAAWPERLPHGDHNCTDR